MTTTTPTNGQVNHSPSSAINQCDDEHSEQHKKVKLDSPPIVNGTTNNNIQQQPSRVVHIRNIPVEATEQDLIAIGSQFGKVTNVLLLKGKNQAFLEFSDLIYANSMIQYWQTQPTPPTIKGRHVFVQFSNHKELKTNVYNDATNNNNSPSPSQEQQLNNNETSIHNNNNNNNASPVLRVIIDHLIYPVNLETLYSIFSRYGKITKIVTFTKSGTYQALIQFEISIQATTAKLALDGQQMFATGNLLKIEYSKLQQLNVKYNNDKSRDFTNPLLPPGNTQQQTSQSAATLGAALNFHHHHHDSIASALDPLGLAGVYGDVIRVKILFNKKDNALVQMLDPQQAQLGNTIIILTSITNIYLLYVCDRIAMTYLDKIKVFGKTIKISPSKHQMVQLPKEGQPDSGLTKDYTNSSLHRFKKPGSKNYLNIYPPSSTLHLSNIPPSVDEQMIRDAFESIGGIQVLNFKFFPKDRKMALIQLNSIEDAVQALIKLHNYQLSESNHLRVSFSKSSI
ncbi:polypyrimidine tract binding protein-like protein [Leptotrombidium deliense]|uniref:Polypyrimidine tract binding protein-like protein n=1 Tax=Leptotrombidium deliense TaxID=299467 RepID=A0A443SKL4_9ACAR|nr:polypyrimidine tract binding protein-like protein [Leptotrombidium deliense]